MGLVDGLSRGSTLPYTQKDCVNCQLNRIGDRHTEDPLLSIKDPKSVIIDASSKNKEIGSSTVVIVTLDPESGILRSAMIGDSGYLLIRPPNNHQLLYRTEEQQHSFNFPYQIGSHGDNPSSAITKDIQVKENDLVILGTDGVFDNLFNENIIDICSRGPSKGILNEEKIASSIAEEAFRRAKDRSWKSPFSINARKSGYRFEGGKLDDITVVVGRVVLN